MNNPQFQIPIEANMNLLNHGFPNSQPMGPVVGSNQNQHLVSFAEKMRPKGPLTAYACFVEVIREEHKKKYPNENVVFSEFAKKCAEKWKVMTPDEKKRFEDMASIDRDRYQRELNNYTATSNFASSVGVLSSGTDGLRRRKRKKTKDPGMPKRAWSAFFFFSHELRPRIREEHPDWRVSEVAKELGKRWEECQNKAKYEAQAQVDRQRYEEEMIKFKNGISIPPSKHCHSGDNSSVTGPVGDEFFDEDDDIDDAEESFSEQQSVCSLKDSNNALRTQTAPTPIDEA